MRPFSVMGGNNPGLAASVPAGSYTQGEVDPTDAHCDLTFVSDGSWNCTDNFSQSGTWKTGAGTGASYWIRWTNTSGTLTTGTAGSYLQLNSSRVFGVSQTSVGTKSCTGTVNIATDAGGTNVIATGSITLNAIVDL